MKVIYEANDGTKFESEGELEKQRDALYDFATEYDSSFKCCTVTPLECFNFIIENISEINGILGVKLKEQTVYTDTFDIEYVATAEFDRCNGCVFTNGTHECHKAAEFFSCGSNKIIWIKK